jgi:hypothetical protein
LNIVFSKVDQAISDLLDANGALLAWAHRDWVRLLSVSGLGRSGYTSEQLLRALIVMFLECDSYRDVVVRIDTSEFLQYFVRLGLKSAMDFTFLNKPYHALRPVTIDKMNGILTGYATTDEFIAGGPAAKAASQS